MATTSNNIPQGYKATALGIIPQEWEVMLLGNLSNSISSGRNKHRDANGQYPVFGSTGIIGYSSTYEYEGPVILVARVGANAGTLNFASGQYDVSDNTLIITIKQNVYDYNFAYNQLTHYKLNKLVFGSGQPLITSKQLKNIRIPVPPLAEQQKIAEVLGVWDEAIEKQARLIEKLALRKRALMQRLLSAKLRLPGFSEPWKKVKLGEIGKFDKGYGVPKESIRNTGNKAITYGEIYTKHDFVIKKFTSYIDDETAVVSKKITQGAILFTGSGETLEDIGKCVAFIDNDIAYAGGDIIIFNPSIEINSLVLSYCLNSAPVNAQKATYGQGHSVVHIYQKDLAKLQVTIPSFPEQNAIAEVLTAADREIELAKEKLERLRSQKRGLMQQLLTGKKRIKL